MARRYRGNNQGESDMKDRTKSWEKFLFGAAAFAFAGSAFARAPNFMPEPSVLSLVGVAIVGAIVVYRLKKKK